MNLLNKLPLIIGIFFIWLYFQNTNDNKPEIALGNQYYSPPETVIYQVKEGTIFDGDTLRVFAPNGDELKIRFSCVDSPERSMKYGIESRDYLRSLLAQNGNKVRLDITNTDRYGRSVAVLYLLNGEAVQVKQVQNGFAYPFEQYSKDCPIWNDIKKAEAIAKNNRVNIYSKNLIKPWDYRQN